jgi:hypothetical protein
VGPEHDEALEGEGAGEGSREGGVDEEGDEDSVGILALQPASPMVLQPRFLFPLR